MRDRLLRILADPSNGRASFLPSFLFRGKSIFLRNYHPLRDLNSSSNLGIFNVLFLVQRGIDNSEPRYFSSVSFFSFSFFPSFSKQFVISRAFSFDRIRRSWWTPFGKFPRRGEEIEFRNNRWWLLAELEKNRCLPVKVRVCRDKRYPMGEKVGRWAT